MNVDASNEKAGTNEHEIGKENEAELRRTRGPTKMRATATHVDECISVQWNSLGQPIGLGSVSLSSFLGPLAREMIPYTLDNWRKLSQGLKDVLWKAIQTRYDVDKPWQRDYIFSDMGKIWRTSKCRMVE
ncbi:hypothetical protein UlMin_005009 [Ulmus minor]